MATGLVKWWRARFLAGYKPFSVVGGPAEGSDSEELLACVSPPCNSSPLPPRILVTPETSSVAGVPANTGTTSSTPTPHIASDEHCNTNNATGNPTRQLSFEEFECDVSVAEGDRRRQEFSFTLYDFDGHGKITKDDIAGLVTTIYDTLGASIQVPPCGSKTIKVKLTVSPDQRATSGSNQTSNATAATAAATAAAIATANVSVKTNHLPGGNVASCCHVKHSASCNHANQASRRAPRRRRPLRSRGEPERVESHSEEDADNVPAALTVTTGTSSSKQEELRRRVGPVPHLGASSPYSNPSSEGDVSDASIASPTSTNPLTPLLGTDEEKRSGSLLRQQLLEIIQANMEKNNLSFHASRKRTHQSEHHHQQQRIPPLPSPYSVELQSPYIERCTPRQATRREHTAYHKPVREQQHHHHNHPASLPKLSAKSRGTSGNIHKHQQRANHASQRNGPPAPIHAVRNNLQQQQHQKSLVTESVNFNSSPTHEKQHHHFSNHTSNSNNINNQKNETQYTHSQNGKVSGVGGGSGSNGDGQKKHQIRHATRGHHDHTRAMEQVVRWLEGEFTQDSVAAATAAAAQAAANRKHVHKHIHHHYHHYHAEALV